MFREIVFTERGVTLADSFGEAEDLLSGFAHEPERSEGDGETDPPAPTRPRSPPRRK
jgi:hypothetical protein